MKFGQNVLRKMVLETQTKALNWFFEVHEGQISTEQKYLLNMN